MSLLWADSFDVGSVAAIQARYESASGLSAITSFRTNEGVNLGAGSLEKRFPRGYETLIVGIANLSGGGLSNEFIRFYDSNGNLQLTLHWDTGSSTYQLFRGAYNTGTLLVSSPAISTGIAIYIEILVTIHPTAGAATLKINEVQQFALTGANTQLSGTRDVGRVQINGQGINGASASIQVDDFYIADTAAPSPLGSFLGNVKIESMVPSGAGDVAGWTKFNDSNWRNVDERPHNSDTDYNYSSTVNASDLFNMGNMSAGSGSIRGVQLTYVARKDDALTRATRPLLKTGGTVYPGSNDSLTTSYAYYYEVWTQNPQTVSEWGISAIDNIQIGYQTTS